MGKQIRGKDLCFAHLVEFSSVNGVNLPLPNPHRDDYLKDLSKSIFNAIGAKFKDEQNNVSGNNLVEEVSNKDN